MNDSLTPFGSRKDRHAKIGQGTIGMEAITNIINHPRLRYLPFYLETSNINLMLLVFRGMISDTDTGIQAVIMPLYISDILGPSSTHFADGVIFGFGYLTSKLSDLKSL